MSHENYKSKNELNPNTKFMSAVSLHSIVLDFATAFVYFIGSLIHRKWEEWLQKPNYTRLNGTSATRRETFVVKQDLQQWRYTTKRKELSLPWATLCSPAPYSMVCALWMISWCSLLVSVCTVCSGFTANAFRELFTLYLQFSNDLTAFTENEYTPPLCSFVLQPLLFRAYSDMFAIVWWPLVYEYISFVLTWA